MLLEKTIFSNSSMLLNYYFWITTHSICQIGQSLDRVSRKGRFEIYGLVIKERINFYLLKGNDTSTKSMFQFA